MEKKRKKERGEVFQKSENGLVARVLCFKMAYCLWMTDSSRYYCTVQIYWNNSAHAS